MSTRSRPENSARVRLNRVDMAVGILQLLEQRAGQLLPVLEDRLFAALEDRQLDGVVALV